MKQKVILSFLLILAMSLISIFVIAKPRASQSLSKDEKANFKTYWQQGKAELNRYRIQQARYGELHKGYEVLIFVTEPFLKDKQVKLDSRWRQGAINVLKLNRVRRFTTGIYDYSMMTSIFKPVNVQKFPRSLKATLTSQDWCGHTFLQFNLRGSKYKINSYSYFEAEGDESFTVNEALLEDEILNTIRLSPNLLPVGQIGLIPSGVVLRLRHTKARQVRARATNKPYTGRKFRGKNLMQYVLSYADGKRTMAVFYEKEHPHIIAGYQDTYKSGFGSEAKVLTTTAIRTQTYMAPYWQQHNNKHLPLRSKLGLKREL